MKGDHTKLFTPPKRTRPFPIPCARWKDDAEHQRLELPEEGEVDVRLALRRGRQQGEVVLVGIELFLRDGLYGNLATSSILVGSRLSEYAPLLSGLGTELARHRRPCS